MNNVAVSAAVRIGQAVQFSKEDMTQVYHDKLHELKLMRLGLLEEATRMERVMLRHWTAEQKPGWATAIESVKNDCKDESWPSLQTRVEVFGAVNTGKSTLIDSICGERLSPISDENTTKPKIEFMHRQCKGGEPALYDIDITFQNLPNFFRKLRRDLEGPEYDYDHVMDEDGNTELQKVPREDHESASTTIGLMLPRNENNGTCKKRVDALKKHLQKDERLLELPPSTWDDDSIQPRTSKLGLTKSQAQDCLTEYTQLISTAKSLSIAPLVVRVQVQGPLKFAAPNMCFVDTMGFGVDDYTTTVKETASCKTLKIAVLDATAINCKEIVLETLTKLREAQAANMETILVFTKACNSETTLATLLDKFAQRAGSADDIHRQLELLAKHSGTDKVYIQELARRCGLLNKKPRLESGVGPSREPDNDAHEELLRIVRHANRECRAQELIDTLKGKPGYKPFEADLGRLHAVFAVEARDALRIVDPEGQRPEMFVTLEQTGVTSIQQCLLRIQLRKTIIWLRERLSKLENVKHEIEESLQTHDEPLPLDATAIDRALTVVHGAFTEAAQGLLDHARHVLYHELVALVGPSAEMAPTLLKTQAESLPFNTLQKHFRAHGCESAYITRIYKKTFRPRFNRAIREQYDHRLFTSEAMESKHLTNLLAAKHDSQQYAASRQALLNPIQHAVEQCLPVKAQDTFMTQAKRRVTTTVKSLHKFFAEQADEVVADLSHVTNMPTHNFYVPTPVGEAESLIRQVMDPVYASCLEVNSETHKNRVKATMIQRLHDGLQRLARGMYLEYAELIEEQVLERLLGNHADNPIITEANRLRDAYITNTRRAFEKLRSGTLQCSREAADRARQSLQDLASLNLDALKQDLEHAMEVVNASHS